jgi:sulfite exporter TauE/SafE
VRAGALGLLTTLLPCGWLYAFVVTAAGTGHPARGALVMTAFWLGTLPVMIGVGLGAQRMFGPLRRRLPVVSAAALVVIGLLSIGGKLGVRHAADHGAPGASAEHHHPAPPAAR